MRGSENCSSPFFLKVRLLSFQMSIEFISFVSVSIMSSKRNFLRLLKGQQRENVCLSLSSHSLIEIGHYELIDLQSTLVSLPTTSFLRLTSRLSKTSPSIFSLYPTRISFTQISPRTRKLCVFTVTGKSLGIFAKTAAISVHSFTFRLFFHIFRSVSNDWICCLSQHCRDDAQC